MNWRFSGSNLYQKDLIENDCIFAASRSEAVCRRMGAVTIIIIIAVVAIFYFFCCYKKQVILLHLYFNQEAKIYPFFLKLAYKGIAWIEKGKEEVSQSNKTI